MIESSLATSSLGPLLSDSRSDLALLAWVEDLPAGGKRERIDGHPLRGCLHQYCTSQGCVWP